MIENIYLSINDQFKNVSTNDFEKNYEALILELVNYSDEILQNSVNKIINIDCLESEQLLSFFKKRICAD